MRVKKLSGSELTAARKIQSIAFNSGTDFSDAAPAEAKSETYGAYNDAGKLCSCAELLPREAFFNGRLMQMACIGGVATLPEERANGCVRALLRHILDEAHMRTITGSFLYPFSHTYYRKFGYELCNTVGRVKISLKAFENLEKTGSVTQFFPEESRQEIIDIYETFAADKNFMLRRSTDSWDDILGADPYKDRCYIYVWRDGAGQARSYAILKIKPEFRADIEAAELIWTTPESLRGILAFMGTFSASYGSFVWNAPSFLNLGLLIKEAYTVETELNCFGMFRIVDAAEIFSSLASPEKEGELSIQLSDDFLTWNNGVFTLSWTGTGSVLVQKTEAEPDITCDIQTAAQLVSGYATPTELVGVGRLFIQSKAEELSELFKNRQGCITDQF